MSKKLMAMLKRPVPTIENGKISRDIQEFEVEVMAVVDGYAMIRRKGCAPFVEPVKCIEIKTKESMK